MIAVLVTIVILAGVFYTASLYYPTRKRAVRVAKSRSMLEAQLETASPTGGDSRKNGVMTDALTMDVNFFSKRNLTPRRGIPELLEQINRISNEMNIRFVAIKPLDEEEAAQYRKYPFLIETRAAYPELVNFVNRIENRMRLSLSNLRIERDPKDVSMHRLQFTLNIVELNDDVDFEPEISAETVSPDSKDTELIAVFRDVFSPKQGTTVAQLPKPPKPAKMVKKKFDIQVTTARIGTLLDTNKACARYYQEARQAYVAKLNDLTDIAIHAKRTRLQDADIIRNKLFRLMDNIEKRLSENKERRTEEGPNKIDLAMLKELRGMIDTHLKTLKYAKEESEKITDQASKQAQPSLVQYVEKQQMNIGDSGKNGSIDEGEIIETEEVGAESDSDDIIHALREARDGAIQQVKGTDEEEGEKENIQEDSTTQT